MKDRQVNCKIVIKNVPTGTLDRYTVVRVSNHEFWFYGTYTKLDKAVKAAEEIHNGYIVEVR